MRVKGTGMTDKKKKNWIRKPEEKIRGRKKKLQKRLNKAWKLHEEKNSKRDDEDEGSRQNRCEKTGKSGCRNTGEDAKKECDQTQTDTKKRLPRGKILQKIQSCVKLNRQK